MADATTRPQVSEALPAPHSMGRSSAGLLIGKGAQMTLGFAFWIVAARVASVEDVGMASGSLSGVMIVTQLSLLGVGAAVILRLPSLGRRDAMALSEVALTIVAISALLGGLAYVTVMRITSEHLQEFLSRPEVVGLLVAACIAGTLGVCLDQLSTALGRGGLAVPRGVVAGLVGVVGLFVLALVLAVGPEQLIAAWVAGLLASVVIGVVQLHRLLGYRPRLRLRHSASVGLLRDGIPNQVLTLTERVPGLLVPVLITAYVSPTLGAYWYPVWMMAWAVFLAPVMVGMAQFAADVRATSDLAANVRTSLKWSLIMGSGIALVLAVLATPLLSLLGDAYAQNGAQALRVLLLALPGVAVIQAYSAACRAHRRVGEAIWVGVGVGVVACATAVYAAATHGLVWAALAWVIAQTLGGVVAGWRLHRLILTTRL